MTIHTIHSILVSKIHEYNANDEYITSKTVLNLLNYIHAGLTIDHLAFPIFQYVINQGNMSIIDKAYQIIGRLTVLIHKENDNGHQ